MSKMSASSLLYRDFSGRSSAAAEAEEPPQDSLETLLAKARGQARADGFADGLEQAEARFDHELRQQLAAIEAALGAARDEAFERSDAQIASLRRLLSVVLSRLSPRLAALNLVDEAVDAVETAIRAAPAETVMLEVSAAQHDAVAERLSGLRGLCEVRAAADLSPTEARVHWRGGFDAIDAHEAAQAAVERLDRRLAEAEADPSGARRSAASDIESEPPAAVAEAASFDAHVDGQTLSGSPLEDLEPTEVPFGDGAFAEASFEGGDALPDDEESFDDAGESAEDVDTSEAASAFEQVIESDANPEPGAASTDFVEAVSLDEEASRSGMSVDLESK
ncbi:MAG: hypothetical protein AAGF90_02780, partial [Pseudomonadota bacterium]